MATAAATTKISILIISTKLLHIVLDELEMVIATTTTEIAITITTLLMNLMLLVLD